MSERLLQVWSVDTVSSEEFELFKCAVLGDLEIEALLFFAANLLQRIKELDGLSWTTREDVPKSHKYLLDHRSSDIHSKSRLTSVNRQEIAELFFAPCDLP